MLKSLMKKKNEWVLCLDICGEIPKVQVNHRQRCEPQESVGRKIEESDKYEAWSKGYAFRALTFQVDKVCS